MNQALVSGLVSGAIYALLGVGIVLVFSVTKLVNLAQGEFYVWGALTATTLLAMGAPVPLAVAIAVASMAVLAAVIDRLVFSRMTDAPHASQLLAGIGVALVMAGAARVLWGTRERSLPELWDRAPIEVFGARIGMQTLILVGALALVCFGLWILLHKTLLGLSMRSVSALSSRAGLFGVNVRSVTTTAFAIAGALGAMAGVLVTPLVFVTYQAGLHLTVYGFIAAAFGGLISIRGAVIGGLLIGVLEAGVAYHGDSALKTPIAFAVLILVLLFQGRKKLAAGAWRAGRLTLRQLRGLARSEILPPVSLQRLSPPRSALIGLGVIVAFAVVGPSLLPPYWISVFSFIGVFVIVGIGLDLLLGYTGQLSLGQTTFTGIAAYLVVLAPRWWGGSVWIALLVALLGTMAIAAVLGAVVLRLRGYYFTLATLAVSIAAEALANGLPGALGGPSGMGVGTTLGIGNFRLDTQDRLFVTTWLVVGILFFVAIRIVRSRFGQQMRAVGFDEVLASSVSVPPFATRLKVFVASALYAAIAGVLYAHILMFVSPESLGFVGGFDSVVGLLLGGFGTVWGALVGIPMVKLLPEFGESFAEYQELIFGLTVVVLILVLPDGVVGTLQRIAKSPTFKGILGKRRSDVPGGSATMTAGGPEREAPILSGTPAPLISGTPPEIETVPVEPALIAESLSKRFGGLTALVDVDFAVRPGQILGLIGPNGAGKSTCLGVLAGSHRTDSGRVLLTGVDVTDVASAIRGRAGLARTFQHPLHPKSMTVLEVAMLGANRGGRSGLTTGVLRSTRNERAAMRAAAKEALVMTGIWHLAEHSAERLSTGEQKLLELARAMASKPSVLLADEPAGGLYDVEVARLGDVLRRLAAAGVAIVLVEHEMGLVMDVCDEIVVLAEGRVIGAGRPADVRSNEEVIHAYLGV